MSALIFAAGLGLVTLLACAALLQLLAGHDEGQTDEERPLLELREDLSHAKHPHDPGDARLKRELSKLRGILLFRGTGDDERARALDTLVRQLHHPSAQTLFEQVARHPDTRVRARLLRTMGAYRTQLGFDLLVREADRARQDHHRDVLLAAIQTLAEWGVPESEWFLGELLTEHDTTVVQRAAEALGRLGTAHSISLLDTLRSRPDISLQTRSAAGAAIQSIHERIDPALLRARGALTLATPLDHDGGALELVEAHTGQLSLAVPLPAGGDGASLSEEPTEPNECAESD